MGFRESLLQNEREKEQALAVERDCLQYLCMSPGMYRTHLQGLFAVFGSASAVCEAPDKEFALWEKTGNHWIRQFLNYRRKFPREEAKNRLERLGMKFAAAGDTDFPERLRRIPDCPFGLFYLGGLPRDDVPSVAVIGARRCSGYGRAAAQKAAKMLARCGVQVISGMAFGIDGIAQEEVVRCGGKSYAVLGCGADVCYPQEHLGLYRRLRQTGGVISEFAPGTAPLAGHFPLRNRIISGLADTVIVVEAAERSGTLITADCALDQGKEVFAVPGRITDPVSAGCNRLIAQGAWPLFSMDDLPEMLGLSCPGADSEAKEAAPLAGDEKLVADLLDVTPVSFEEILEKSGFSYSRLSSVLLKLQLKGAAREVAKNLYARGAI